MAKSMGCEARSVLLENHGPLCCGETLAVLAIPSSMHSHIDGRLQEAFSSMYNLTRACTYQIKALSAVGGDLSRFTDAAYCSVLNYVSRLHLPSDDEAKRMQKCDARTTGKKSKAPVEQNPDKADTLAGREIMWRRWVRAIETRDGANNTNDAGD